MLFAGGVLDWARHDGVDPVAQRWKIFFPQVLRFNHVVQINGDSARPDQPACFLVELKRTDDTDGNNGRAELQRHPKHSVFERADAAIPRSLPFGEYSEAHSGIERGAS